MMLRSHTIFGTLNAQRMGQKHPSLNDISSFESSCEITLDNGLVVIVNNGIGIPLEIELPYWWCTRGVYVLGSQKCHEVLKTIVEKSGLNTRLTGSQMAAIYSFLDNLERASKQYPAHHPFHWNSYTLMDGLVNLMKLSPSSAALTGSNMQAILRAPLAPAYSIIALPISGIGAACSDTLSFTECYSGIFHNFYGVWGRSLYEIQIKNDDTLISLGSTRRDDPIAQALVGSVRQGAGHITRH